jgi:hypothetical protein
MEQQLALVFVQDDPLSTWTRPVVEPTPLNGMITLLVLLIHTVVSPKSIGNSSIPHSMKAYLINSKSSISPGFIITNIKESDNKTRYIGIIGAKERGLQTTFLLLFDYGDKQTASVSLSSL